MSKLELININDEVSVSIEENDDRTGYPYVITVNDDHDIYISLGELELLIARLLKFRYAIKESGE